MKVESPIVRITWRTLRVCTLVALLTVTAGVGYGATVTTTNYSIAVGSGTLTYQKQAVTGIGCGSTGQLYAFGQRHSSFCHRPVVKWKDGFQQSCYGVA